MSCRKLPACGESCTRPKDENGRCDLLNSIREERILRLRAKYGDYGARKELRKMEQAYSEEQPSTAQNGRPQQ